MADTNITRRQALGAAGGAGVAFLFAGRAATGGAFGPELAEAAAATCVMTPAKTEGPYFVDELLNRSNITTDSDGSNAQAGTPLALTMYVFDAGNDCAPVAGATVDIWHANAAGKYSDVSQNGTVGQKWLRGYQVTAADGKVTFDTIWPGWYSGRAVHIHFKVRTAGLEFTSQMFFTDAKNAEVFTKAPYASRPTPDVTDGEDSILGGDAATLTLAPTASGSGYKADFSVGLASGSGTATDTTVSAALDGAKVVSLSGGRRQVRVRITPAEPVTLAVRLTRSGHRLATKKATLPAGATIVKVGVGSGVKAGGARLTLKLADASGNRRSFEKSVHVPKRKL